MVIDEIISTVSERENYDYEIICVNDCSPDNVYHILKQLAEMNEKIKVINLAKNMGKHAAVLAGYSFVSGEYIVNLDDDYQCPTYELWRLLEPVEQGGYDLSTARYHQKKQAKWKNLGSKLNAYVGAVMLGKPRGLTFENFSVIKRFVADEMIKYTHTYPYLEGLMLRVTHRVAAIPMDERERGDNNSSGYTFYKSVSLFSNGFTAFSVKPLRISTVAGILAALTGFAAGVGMVIRKILNPDILLGYTSTVVVQLFVGGLILMCLGIMGEYIGRIYICINNSPQYVIRDTINTEICLGEKVR